MIRLETLPSDILFDILQFCSAKDLCSIASTSQALREISSLNQVWRIHFIEKYGRLEKVNNYKQIYMHRNHKIKRIEIDCKQQIDMFSKHTPSTSPIAFRGTVLGEHLTGKTEFLTKFCKSFKHEIHERQVIIGSQTFQLVFRERLQQVGRFQPDYRIVFLCFDITNSTSFAKLDDWMNYIDKVGIAVSGYVILIGTKADLCKQRQVSYEIAEKCASFISAPYIEISSKTGEGMETLYNSVVATMLAQEIKYQKGTKYYFHAQREKNGNSWNIFSSHVKPQSRSALRFSF